MADPIKTATDRPDTTPATFDAPTAAAPVVAPASGGTPVGQNVTTQQGEQTVLSKSDVEKMINDAVGKVDEKILPITGKIDKFEKRLVTDKASLMTVFGIFASVVTFLSVEIQFLKNVCDPLRLVGFSLILLASLLSFVWILHLIANYWINEKVKDHPKLLVFFIFLLFVFGGWLLFAGKDEISCRENFLYEKYSNDFNTRQIELKDGLDKEMNGFQEQWSSDFKNLEQKINDINNKAKTPGN
ncbi:MAG: hypothetical protein WC843_02360 [Candidatus Gracilibacteria bacterium]